MFQVYTFNECRVMVRRPALQVIETLRNLGENETPKFVLCILFLYISICSFDLDSAFDIEPLKVHPGR